MRALPDFEAYFNASPYPCVLMSADLTIVGANSAYLRATGARGEDIIGRYAFSAFPPNPDDPESTDMAQVHASVALAIRTRESQHPPVLRYAMRRDGPDGPTYENRYWSLQHTPVLDERGEVIFVAQNTIDVTDIYAFGDPRDRIDYKFTDFHQARTDEALIRALSNESSHLRNLFKQAPGFVAVLKGREGIFEMANEAYYQMVGHRSILGKPLIDAIPELAGQGYEKLVERVFDTGEPYVGLGAKATVQRVPGGPFSEIYVDFVFQPIVEQGGKVTGVFVQGHDVTEAHEAQLARQASDQRLREGLETARMAVWEWEIGSGRLTYSDNAAAVFGSEWDDIDTAWQAVHPEDMEGLRAAVAAAIETRTGYDITNRLVRPDNGEAIWLHTRAHVVCDAAGNPTAVRGVSLDISERRRAEIELERVNRTLAERVEQLAMAERRQAFQLAVSDSLRRIRDPDAVAEEVCKLLGRYLGVARVLCGEYDAERQVVHYHSNYTDGKAAVLSGPYPVDAFGASNFSVLAAGHTWTSDDMEHDPRTAGPDTWPTFAALDIYSAVVVPLNRKGSLTACLFVNSSTARHWTAEEIGLIEDISERMWNAIERLRAEEGLRQADMRKDEFLAMLAHELRNPLAPISAAAELLRIGALGPDSIRKTSQVISRQVGHMTGLVNDLLDVSRVTRGLVELDRQPLDIKRVVADAVEQLGPLIDSRRHRLTVRMAPTALQVEGDYKRLVQVLANLLANAAKYTPEGGSIGLDLDVTGETVTIRVSDNGIGIPPEVLPHVFDLFSQAQRTPDRSQGGLGLGLALVRSLVELHGGAVGACSDGPGTGSAFTVRLPCKPAGQLPAVRAARTPGVLPFSRTLRLMVVDDNADAANMLQLLLEGSGHDVVVEHDALAALERAHAEKFDAFLLDIGLPRMEGRELARRLRRCDGNGGAVLVAVTGYGQQCDRVSALESGFDHFFVKPVDAEKLLEVLEGAHAQGA